MTAEQLKELGYNPTEINLILQMIEEVRQAR